jgi:hypothetical protein
LGGPPVETTGELEDGDLEPPSETGEIDIHDLEPVGGAADSPESVSLSALDSLVKRESSDVAELGEELQADDSEPATTFGSPRSSRPPPPPSRRGASIPPKPPPRKP